MVALRMDELVVTSEDVSKRRICVKDALSGLRQFVGNENPLKMIKNAFHFTLKALFVLKIFKFLS